MTRLPLSALALGLTALLAGCSSTQSNAPKDTTIQAEACCSDFSQFPWVTLKDQERLAFRIDAASPVGQFSDGKSYFAAFTLPERADRVRIRLNSWMENGQVFAPRLLLLDPQFRIVTQTEQSQLRQTNPDALHKASYALELELQASKTPYVVLYSPEAFRAGAVQMPHPARIRAQELGEPMPMVTDPVYQHAPFGRLELDLETLTLRPYQAKPAKQPAALAPTVAPAASAARPREQPETAAPTGMLKETEQFYNQQIREAVARNDIRRALKLVEEAKRAGSPSAEDLLVELLKKK